MLNYGKQTWVNIRRKYDSLAGGWRFGRKYDSLTKSKQTEAGLV